MNHSTNTTGYKFLYFMSDKKDFIKTTIISFTFFIAFFCYTLLKELKDSVFILIVGQKYIPDAKNISYLIMIPLIFIYSFIASRCAKHWLLIIYSIFYGLGGLICAYAVADEQIGLSNSVASSHRIFGWIYYLFMDSINPFFVSVLWAFFNSMSKPEEVKTKYMIVTIASKIGGMFSAFLAWLFMSRTFEWTRSLAQEDFYVILLAIASVLILAVPFMIGFLINIVPKNLLYGYSPVHQQEKEEEGKKKQGFVEGFYNLFKYPYTLGIFGMIFFWEIVNVIFNYMRLGIGLKESTSITDFSAFLYKNILFAHIIGFILVICGTTPLVRFLGEKISLLVIPLATGGAILFSLIYQQSSFIVFTYVFIQAINYAFSYPLREALYIPTTNQIKFQTKSWIDSFGSRLSKAVGSSYNKLIQYIPLHFVNSFQTIFFVCIIISWTVLALVMGKRWEKTVKNNEVIG